MNLKFIAINESFRLFALLCFAFIVESVKWSGGDSKPQHGKHVVCYVGTWSVYRPSRGSFKIEDINGNLCTHIIYAFVGLNAKTNLIRSIDPYYDLEENYGKGSFRKMTQLKSKYPHLKVTLAVGGWNEGSYNYSTMALEPDSRRKFINSVLEYVTRYGFDGFDLDWEFPTARGGRKEDKQNFALLVKELKQELSKKGLILTAALGASPHIINTAYDIPEISKYLDLIHLMSYDYHGPWDKTVGPNAPLRSTDGLDLDSSVKLLLKLGAPPGKLVLGIPAYGHTFLTDGDTGSGFGSKVTGPGPEGTFTGQKGFQGYNEICAELLRSEAWSKHWDEKSSSPYAAKGNLVLAYDNERSIFEKVKLGLEYKLGGFMLWSIDTDDFHGDCGKERLQTQETTNSRYSYPLLRAIHEAIERQKPFDAKGITDINSNDIDDVTPVTPESSANPLSSISLCLTVITLLFRLVI